MKRMWQIHAVLLLAAVLAGCSRETELTGSGTGADSPVTVFVMPPSARSGETSDPNAEEGDGTIVDFRIMVFKYGGGQLIRNEYVEDITASNVDNMIELNILTGVYDFLFIANEKADALTSDLHVRLENYDPEGAQKYMLDDLLREYFPYTDFTAGRPIPMTSLYRSVSISSDNTVAYTEDNSPRQANSVWPVGVHRLGVRLDLKLETPFDELKDNITGLTIRVPRKVYLINDRSGASYSHPNNTGAISEATVDVSFGYGGGNGVFTGGAKPYVWTLPRIVLPENTFDPFGDEGRAMRIGAHFSGNISSLYGFVTYDRGDGDFTAPRNYIYSMTGTMTEVIRFDGTVVEWGGYEQSEIDLSDTDVRIEPESNCYVVEPDSDPIGIPTKLLTDERLADYILPSVLDGELSGLRAAVLWSDTEGNGSGFGENAAVRAVRFVNKGTLENSYVLVTPGNKAGNAVVILYEDDGNRGYDLEDDTVVYSWHIWTNAEKYRILAGQEGKNATTGGTLYWMDRNLGAKYNYYEVKDEAGVVGLQYQWGRKDPFPGAAGLNYPDNTITIPVYGVQAPLLPDMVDGPYLPDGQINQSFSVHDLTTIAGSIENPARMYFSTTEVYEWCTDAPSPSIWNDPTVAKTGKSIFDPCPPGWKVPDLCAWKDDLGNSSDVGLWEGVVKNTYGVWNDLYGGYYPIVILRTWGLLLNVGETFGIRQGGYWHSEISDDISAFVFIYHVPTEGCNYAYSPMPKSYGANVRCVKQ